MAFWKYEYLPPRGLVPQTKVTYIQQLDPKGLIPKSLVDSKMSGHLVYLSDMRKQFDKSVQVDEARKSELLLKIDGMHVKGEGAAGVEAQFKTLFAEKKGSEEVKVGLGSARSKVKADKASSFVWGQTSVPVRADINEVAAFLFDYDR